MHLRFLQRLYPLDFTTPSETIVLTVNTEPKLPLAFDFSSVPTFVFCQTLGYVNTGISELEQPESNLVFVGHAVSVITFNSAVAAQKKPQTIRRCMNVAAFQ